MSRIVGRGPCGILVIHTGFAYADSQHGVLVLVYWVVTVLVVAKSFVLGLLRLGDI